MLQEKKITYCGIVGQYGHINLVNITSGDSLVADGTKLLPELML